MKAPPSAAGHGGWFGQALRFGLVGVANAVVDFGTFNVLQAAGVGIVLSNIASTSAGMAFSFFANRKFVFLATGGGRRQFLLFLACTSFSMYVLQTVVIVGVTGLAPGLLDQAVRLASLAGLHSDRSSVLLRSNAAKLIATVASLSSNFLLYRFVVFAKGRPEHDPREAQ